MRRAQNRRRAVRITPAEAGTIDGIVSSPGPASGEIYEFSPVSTQAMTGGSQLSVYNEVAFQAAPILQCCFVLIDHIVELCRNLV